MITAISVPATFAAPALWAALRVFIVTFFNLFGAPEQLAAKGALTAKAYKQTLSWLRAGEAMLRRLVLIEAAHYAKPNLRPLLRERRKRIAKLRGFDASQPQCWRVSFRCFSADDRRCAGRTRRKCSQPVRVLNAWPLAERAEAILRVFNNPEPYARRVARRLHSAPHRAKALLRHPPNAPDIIGRESFADTGAACMDAIQRFESG